MIYHYPNSRILVFAKAPIAGHCKTRMQPKLSPEESTQLQQALTWHTLETVCKTQLAPVELYYSPSTVHPFHLDCLATFPIALFPQTDGSLGERMHHAFCQSLSASKFTVIIGVDCPTIDTQYLDKALKALYDEVDCVVGPANDGGYVLIGLRQPQATLFKNISWGSNQVFQQTIEKINALELKFTKMQNHSDIDTTEDLLNLLNNPNKPLPIALSESLLLKLLSLTR